MHVVNDDGVEAVVTMNVTTLSDDIGPEIVRETATHGVVVAQVASVFVDRPERRIDAVVDEGLRRTAELVLLTNEEIESEDGEYDEHEGQGDADVD